MKSMPKKIKTFKSGFLVSTPSKGPYVKIAKYDASIMINKCIKHQSMRKPHNQHPKALKNPHQNIHPSISM